MSYLHRRKTGGRQPGLVRRGTFAGLAFLALALIASAAAEAQAPGHPLTLETGEWELVAPLARARWSPYVVGVSIGILSWLTFLLSDKPLGVSGAYAGTAGMVERLFRGDKVLHRPYYRENEPRVDWKWVFVLGIPVGAFVSARLGGTFRWEWVPPLWESAWGYTPVWRALAAFAGGLLVGLGARWAGGCTSGHGISGALQLVVSSWVALLCFFAGGVASAMLVFNVLR